ncbi:TetR/AcrR family transcriptional regulator [Nocardioides sp.]|uniref:TetR/AcrR family transcriptional regulator n=1 Tax=Nocardioides sp. TaxID=35761 RepID=UPI0039E60E54
MHFVENPEAHRPYHHGDLRNALVGAAADLAEVGGPEAVTIRAAARAVGVTPTAAYRHFAGQAELLHAAKDEALDRMTATITGLVGQPPADAGPIELAVRQLTAAGRGYLEFAIAQPGLFRTAFCHGGEEILEEGPDFDPEQVLMSAAPYAFLAAVLDTLVDVGWLAPGHRPNAEMAAWSTVHGLAMLLLDGLCRHLSEERREEMISATLDAIVRGFATGPEASARSGVVSG